MLRASLTAAGGLLLSGCASAPLFQGISGPRPRGAERWVLLSDPHIAADRSTTARGVNMAEQLRAAQRAVLASSASSPPPAGLIVNGDCAFASGEHGDYRALHALLVEPIASAGVPLHLTLGNHDRRRTFVDVLERPGLASPVVRRWVSVVPARYANWFLLDSLDERLGIGGSIGVEQLRWLDAALAGAADRPAIVVGHHPPARMPDLFGAPTGLADASALWRVLIAHRHVKAYVFGHTHCWNVARRDGIYLINLPSTAYVFDDGQPSGWIECWLGREGAQLTLWTVDGNTSQQDPGRSASIRWS